MRQQTPPSEPLDDSQRPIKVAIVGTGLAGLTTAFLLQQDQRQRYAVTLFEQADTLAFDGASVAVKNERTGQVERVDLPMRASAGGYYANLNRMYEYLQVPMHPIRFMFVFAKALSASASSQSAAAGSAGVGSAPGTYFVHASNLHQMPPPWPGTRGVVAHVFEILYLIICQFWFSIACFFVPPRSDPVTGGESVAAYLERLWLPRRYVSHYLLPLMSSVSTCTHEQFLAFPASDLVNYKKLSHGQKHYAVCGGVSQVQSRLAAGLEDVRLQARVLEVLPTENSVDVRWTSYSPSGEGDVKEERFDRAVLAVSPDVAGKIFKPLAHTIGKIPTLQVESSVHRPRFQGHRSDDFSVVDSPDTLASCMHHSRDASRAQTITLRTLFADKASRSEAAHAMPSGVVVSTCPLEEGDAKGSLQTARFTRTLRTTQSRALVERIMGRAGPMKKSDGQASGWVSGENGVWLTGAWCWDGMVLLEGCVVSAMQIARDYGVDIPWEAR